MMEDSNYDNYTQERANAEAGCGLMLIVFIVALFVIAGIIIGRVATVGHVF